MGTNATSRRDLLRAASTAIAYVSGAAIVGTGMALATNAKGETVATGLTPFRVAEARYWAAHKRLNGLTPGFETQHPREYAREERAYLDAVEAVDAAPVATWEEFADQIDIMFDGGESQPGDAALHTIFANARRLAGRA